MPALVVSLEGPDFSGKSTIANLLVEVLRKNAKKDGKSIMFKRTEVPSNLTTGFAVKAFRNSKDDVSSNVFALAYATDHLHHYETMIKPLKQSDKNFVVIQERSLLSTIIYQSLIGKAELKWMRELSKFNANIPDLTLVLKIPSNEILKRSQLEKRDSDKFETPSHVEEQLKIYYNLPDDLKNEFHAEYIEADTDPDEIAERCARRVQEEIDKRFSVPS